MSYKSISKVLQELEQKLQSLDEQILRGNCETIEMYKATTAQRVILRHALDEIQTALSENPHD